jgi:hypothetical protein
VTDNKEPAPAGERGPKGGAAEGDPMSEVATSIKADLSGSLIIEALARAKVDFVVTFPLTLVTD